MAKGVSKQMTKDAFRRWARLVAAPYSERLFALVVDLNEHDSKVADLMLEMATARKRLEDYLKGKEL